MTKPKVLSLFSGAGGLDLGFEAAGFDVVLSSDIMVEASDTLRLNRRDRPVFGPPGHSGDVFDVTPEVVKSLTGLGEGEVDVMIGGPPCQTFSVAAAQRFLKSDSKFKRKGFDCEHRGQLIFAYLELILALRPKSFLIENVPGILTIDGGEGIKLVTDKLSTAGYTVATPVVLDAKEFGVPQSRKRAFIIGSRDGMALSPILPTHDETASLYCKEYRSVAEALMGFEFTLENAEIRSHSEQVLSRYKALSVGQREHLGRVDRLDPALPSKTVIAGGTAGGGRSHLHPYQARTLSVRECARLQTFPDSYIFFGGNGRQFTQVGNAVPPLLAEVLAHRLIVDFFGLPAPATLKFAVPAGERGQATARLLEWSIRTRPELLYDDVTVP